MNGHIFVCIVLHQHVQRTSGQKYEILPKAFLYGALFVSVVAVINNYGKG